MGAQGFEPRPFGFFYTVLNCTSGAEDAARLRHTPATIGSSSSEPNDISSEDRVYLFLAMTDELSEFEGRYLLWVRSSSEKQEFALEFR